MASCNEHEKRQLPPDAEPHLPRPPETDSCKRQRLVDSAAALRQPSREPRPQAEAVAAATTLPTSTGPDPGPFQHTTTAGSPVPPQPPAPASVAVGEPDAHVVAQPASSVLVAVGVASDEHCVPDSAADATGITLHGPCDEEPDLAPFRAIVVGSAAVLPHGRWRKIRLGSKLHQRCTAASVRGRAAVVTELLGARYQLSVERRVDDEAEWDSDDEAKWDSDDSMIWALGVPPVLPDAFTADAPPQTHYTAPLYVVQPPHLSLHWFHRFGEPDGALSLDVVSELTGQEVETVENVLWTRLDEHEYTLRSIAGDVAAKLAGATDASAEDMDRECDQPHRNAQRRACEQMVAELRALHECEQRWIPECRRALPRAWRRYERDGVFGLMDAAAALGCNNVIKQLRALGVGDGHASPYGTPAELIVRLRGAMWDLVKQEKCQRSGFWTRCAPRKSSPPQVVAGAGSHSTDGAVPEPALTRVPAPATTH